MSDIKSKAFIDYLGCKCTYFPESDDDAPIIKAYNEARSRGKKEGFLPVIVTIDDTLWECLIFNSDEENGDKEYIFNPDKVAEYRKNMLEAELKDGKELASGYLQERREEYEEDYGVDLDEIMGEMDLDGGEYDEENGFASIWGYGSPGTTVPLVLAEIPVQNPWEIFAYVPFGAWNECPDTPELMAITKYWYEQYGAVPAVITHDVLEMSVDETVKEEKAMQLALEMYGFCPDIVDQGCEEVGVLAATLVKSKTWYFWWD